MDKSVDLFNKSARNKDGFHSYCRKCQSDHYQDNRAAHLKNVRKNKILQVARLRKIVAERFTSGCVDCGNLDIRVLEFDHLVDKIDSVSRMIAGGYSTQKVVAEMDKCEVRCRNCHGIKTLERLGGSWHDKYRPM